MFSMLSFRHHPQQQRHLIHICRRGILNQQNLYLIPPTAVALLVATLEPGLTRLADLNRIPGDARPKPLIKSISLMQEFSFSNLCESDFNLGRAHKHLHLTKYIYYEGNPCPFKMIYKIDVQSSNCFYKISMFKTMG